MSNGSRIVLKVPPDAIAHAIVVKVPPNTPQGLIVESSFDEFSVTRPGGSPGVSVVAIIQDGKEQIFQGNSDHPLTIRVDEGEIVVTVPPSDHNEYQQP